MVAVHPTIAETNIQAENSLSVMDLFSGCGGMSLGFKQAGFHILLAIDIDSVANREYAANLNLNPLQLDLFEVTAGQILARFV